MSSKFPNEIDKFIPFLDLTTNDGEKIKKYEIAMQQNNFAEASRILATIENVEQKILSASRFNQIKDSVIATQEFYGKNVKPYIEQKQNEWENIISQFEFKGEYNSTTRYKINNMVSFISNGIKKIYLRINGDNLNGQPPSDTKYWRTLTVEGERGTTDGRTTTFYNDWSSSQTYNKNAIVVYNNKWWISKQTNLNKEPLEGGADWELLMVASQVIYPVQTNQPLAQEVGELWFKVI